MCFGPTTARTIAACTTIIDAGAPMPTSASSTSGGSVSSPAGYVRNALYSIVVMGLSVP